MYTVLPSSAKTFKDWMIKSQKTFDNLKTNWLDLQQSAQWGKNSTEWGKIQWGKIQGTRINDCCPVRELGSRAEDSCDAPVQLLLHTLVIMGGSPQ